MRRGNADFRTRRCEGVRETDGSALPGEVPIDLAIREGGDNGRPVVEAYPDSPQTKVFMDMASALRKTLGL